MERNEKIDQRPDRWLVPDSAARGCEQYVDTTAPQQAEHEAQTQALLDPFDNDQGIEYWLWNGARLVPAWPDEIGRIREREQAREEEFQAELRRQRAARRQRLLRPLTRLAPAIMHIRVTFGRLAHVRSGTDARSRAG